MTGAKRIQAGIYEYRGYRIQNMGGVGCRWWNITWPGETCPDDKSKTKRKAMKLIDYWTNKRATYLIKNGE